MVWSKTETGRQEIKARSQVTGRAQRTLLLLVDGRRGEAELLALVVGTSPSDLHALAALGLIGSVDEIEPTVPMPLVPATPPGPVPSAALLAQAPFQPLPLSLSPSAAPVPAAAPQPRDPRGGYVDLSSALTETIARELGLRGFVLTMAAERASTLDELRAVAERTIAAVADRKGEAQGRAVRRALLGE